MELLLCLSVLCPNGYFSQLCTVAVSVAMVGPQVSTQELAAKGVFEAEGRVVWWVQPLAPTSSLSSREAARRARRVGARG